MEELKSVSMEHGPLYVMNNGMMLMQVLYATNLDTQDMVCSLKVACRQTVTMSLGKSNVPFHLFGKSNYDI